MLLKDNVGLRYERFSSAMSGFFVVLKWICAVLVLVSRLVGLSMFIVWASYCFFREFRTTALCVKFHLFPEPRIFECLALPVRYNIFVLDLLCAQLEPFPWVSAGFTAPD